MYSIDAIRSAMCSALTPSSYASRAHSPILYAECSPRSLVFTRISCPPSVSVNCVPVLSERTSFTMSAVFILPSSPVKSDAHPLAMHVKFFAAFIILPFSEIMLSIEPKLSRC